MEDESNQVEGGGSGISLGKEGASISVFTLSGHPGPLPPCMPVACTYLVSDKKVGSWRFTCCQVHNNNKQ